MALVLSISTLLGVQSAPSPSPDAAVIVNSGSTNTTPYHIVVQRDGTTTYTTDAAVPITATRKLQRRTIRPLFHDLTAAQPLDKLSVLRCMKSTSFGSITYIRFHGETTPDLSCPSSMNAARLYQEVLAIQRQLDLPHRAHRSFRRTL